MDYKLTIDQNLMYEEPNIPAIDILRRWKQEGKVELIEAERPRGAIDWHVPQAKDGIRGRGRSSKGHPGGVNFKALAGIVFPQKNPNKLELYEYNNVVHLSKHHDRKNEFFVTRNTSTFIEHGKRERLKEVFGILAVTPEEVVELISKMEGWPEKS